MLSKPKRDVKPYLKKKCDSQCFENLLRRDKRCQRCRKTTTLVPSHCYGKKAYPTLRHDLLNLLLLCDECHKWWHAHPIDAWIWFKEKWFGRFTYLQSVKNISFKLNKIHYQNKVDSLNVELNEGDWGE